MTLLLRRGLAVLLSLVVLLASASSAVAGETVPGARALEARLYAPCCWNGTLDNHDSPLAKELRAEIETRIAKGEGSDAIQADMVQRYGDKVLAARSDSPIRNMGVALAVLIGGVAIVLLYVVRKWVRRSTTDAPANDADDAPKMNAKRSRDEMDDRIDEELAEVK